MDVVYDGRQILSWFSRISGPLARKMDIEESGGSLRRRWLGAGEVVGSKSIGGAFIRTSGSPKGYLPVLPQRHVSYLSES